ncbi:MAG TPA: ABC transporter permease [Acidimicrobiales bacterium]|nr:ABC transporter permease [Acidimicrobiales bacterium]
MNNLTYVRYEVLRTVRNRRFLIFSLVFPLILFLTIAGAHRNIKVDGIGFPLYYMTGMAAWGSMTSVISSGARIAQERQVGWTRQLRITPLKTITYFSAKILTGYLMALFSIVVLALAGTLIGVRLDATGWLTMLGLLLVGLIPFAVMGIMLGHLISVDSLGPAIGGITSLFALLGGVFGPLVTGGALFAVVKCLPSYWLVQAGKSALEGGHIWTSQAWIVIAVWSIVLARVGARVYRRDTQKV